jgi:hypothetical protein
VSKTTQSKQMAEASCKFLENDFNQCFEQMRYYDSQIFEIVKHSFVVYSGLLGLSLTLYKLGLDNEKDFSFPAMAMLIVGVLFGLYLFALVVRNRVYFVLVTRYLNEHRSHFLKMGPLKFENLTKMYTNREQPPYFNWLSSQSWYMYLMATLNSTLLVAVVFILMEKVVKAPTGEVCELFTLFMVSVIGQIVAAIAYLQTREKKSASAAVFGKE